jgi:N-acetylmuramic acid 6-phosphate etherase
MEDLRAMTTEGRRADLADLDLRPTIEQVLLANDEDATVAAVVRAAAFEIARVVDAIGERLAAGGRLRYVGAGTPGRLAALDAAECVPTFGVSLDLVVAVVAGGAEAMLDAKEGLEDDYTGGGTDLDAAGLDSSDVVLGISASGRTPYVLGAMARAHEIAALTIGLSCTTGSALSAACDMSIEIATGPELIAGSTRLKAGTAQKLVLNTLSTLVMVKLGRTYGNLMVDVSPDNDKLRLRAQRVVEEATGAVPEVAEATLAAAEGQTRTAIVALLADVDIAVARQRLEASGGRIREAVRPLV